MRQRVMTVTHVVFLVGILLSPMPFETAAHAEVTSLPINKCLAGKIKGVGKSLAARTACVSKETSSGVDDPSCPAKASDKFTGGVDPSKGVFNKLEAKYLLASTTPCLTFADQALLEASLTGYAANVSASTGMASGKCDAAKIKCIGKYVAAVTSCDSKAAGKTGMIDTECTGKAAGKLANGVKGCLDKAALNADCTNGGSQAMALRGAADQFIQDVLCALHPGNVACQAPTPTPTATPTPTSVCTPANLSAGLYTQRQVVVAGQTRRYDLYIPPNCAAASCPLVLDFHGFTSNKTDQRTISGFQTLADTAPFVVAFPQGRFGLPLGNPDGEGGNPLDGPSWNAGSCCGRAVVDGIDDVAFSRAVVVSTRCQTPVDDSRVYATGLSNGGGMAHRLACEASDLFAAVAPIASPVLLDPLTQCAPARPVPVIHFAGTTDPIVPYGGGSIMFPQGGQSCAPPSVSLATVPSAASSFARWRDVDGCGSGPPDQTVPVGGGMCERYTSCAGGVEVELCSITGDNGGSIGGQFFCPFLPSCYDGHALYCNQDIANIATTAWVFMSQFTLP